MNQHPLAVGGRIRGLLIASLALGLVAALTVSCSSDPKPPPKVVETPKTSAPAASAAPDASKDSSSASGSLIIDDKITQACGGLPTAHFDFNAAALSVDAKFALDGLAKCFISGPLKGRKMRLVGHADPRGETEYNVALGQRRAGSVGDYMILQGMQKSNVETLSKGAIEATGKDESGWARDRKVEVFLAE